MQYVFNLVTLVPGAAFSAKAFVFNNDRSLITVVSYLFTLQLLPFSLYDSSLFSGNHNCILGLLCARVSQRFLAWHRRKVIFNIFSMHCRRVFPQQQKLWLIVPVTWAFDSSYLEHLEQELIDTAWELSRRSKTYVRPSVAQRFKVRSVWIIYGPSNCQEKNNCSISINCGIRLTLLARREALLSCERSCRVY